MPTLYAPNKILSSLRAQKGFEKPRSCTITSATVHPSSNSQEELLELMLLDDLNGEFHIRYDLVGAAVYQPFFVEGGVTSAENLVDKTIFLYRQEYIPEYEKRNITHIRNALGYPQPIVLFFL